jgi:hypothetical protein
MRVCVHLILNNLIAYYGAIIPHNYCCIMLQGWDPVAVKHAYAFSVVKSCTFRTCKSEQATQGHRQQKIHHLPIHSSAGVTCVKATSFAAVSAIDFALLHRCKAGATQPALSSKNVDIKTSKIYTPRPHTVILNVAAVVYKEGFSGSGPRFSCRRESCFRIRLARLCFAAASNET